MKSNQARVNMDTARDIQHDKSIKTKAEKDRRLKEKQSNNTKVNQFNFSRVRAYEDYSKNCFSCSLMSGRLPPFGKTTASKSFKKFTRIRRTISKGSCSR